MKLIAHRGASLLHRENTLESLICASQMGADAVECDVWKTADGKYIIFHDPTLDRIAGDGCVVAESTLTEISDILERKAGYRPITLDDLIAQYHEDTPILLDIGIPADEEFLSVLKRLPFPFIIGVSRPDDVAVYRSIVPSERLLGFMPSPDHAEAFLRDGVGIIRLWEHWLDSVTPDDIRRLSPDVEVYIMSNRDGCMDGCEASIDRMKTLGADGVLLNDITLLPYVKA